MSNLYIGSRHCSVCQCSFNSEAELAIHEFSKKHCDNLIRLSKNKPVKTKAPKPVVSNNEKIVDTSEVPIPQPVNLSLYGYFNQNDMINTQPKEYNTEYDPYLQKLAENPYKISTEKELPATVTTSFSRNKKKKKKSCQICNVSMMNIPEYEAHMKSPQHIYKLKLSGMGVSAHFVKASTNLHTTEKEENLSQSVNTSISNNSAMSTTVPMSPSELFCDTCEVLLNSMVQFQAHLSGKTHLDNLQRKQSVNISSPDRLFCYTCKLSLTNFLQFNEHKNGKKHRAKCNTLLRSGITIPPEERPLDMAWNIVSSSVTIYPEGYKKEVFDKQEATTQTSNLLCDSTPVSNEVREIAPETPIVPKVGIVFQNEKNIPSQMVVAVINKSSEECTKDTVEFECSLCESKFPSQPPFEMHLNSETHALKLASLRISGLPLNTILSKLMTDRKTIIPDKYHRYCCGICAIVSQNAEESERHLKSLVHKYAIVDYTKKRRLEILQSIEANDKNMYCCKFCDESWEKLTEYNAHLHCLKHKTLSWKERQKKFKTWRLPHLQLKRLNSWRGTCQRNPGVRTKIGGIAKDLISGEVEMIPNLEVIEPKIDNSKNVSLGLSRQSRLVKKKVTILAARRRPGMVYRKVQIPHASGVPKKPYPPPLLETPIVPHPTINSPILPPRSPYYNNFPRPNFVQHRPFFRPMPPSQFMSWRPNYRPRRYY